MNKVFTRISLVGVVLLLAALPALAATMTVTVSTDKASYGAGETVKITAVARYDNGTAVTSVKSATVTITDPAGTTVVRNAALTNAGSGNFTYSYTLASTAPSGTWKATCTIEDRNRVKGSGSATFGVGSTPPPTGGHADLTWTGYGMCKDCHRTAAQDMYQSVHYQWKGSASGMTTGPASQGKMDALDGSSALNAYCINILGNWNACGTCHAGTGAKPVATTNPTDAQLSSIDCLICHNDPVNAPYSRVRNASTGLFEPAPGVDMNKVVRAANIKPTRRNCLVCHARAGGGDAVKRGDLALASGITGDYNFDVHMSSLGGNLACQSCHTVSRHRVAGRGSDLRPKDSSAAVNCSTTTCHPTKTSSTGHVTAAVNKHIARVACQTCHIKTYARNASDTVATEATETHRDWTKPHWHTTSNRYEPTLTLANDLKPRYAFWNGTSWGNNLMDAAVIDPATGRYKISRPNGSISDTSTATKLYPFKYKTAFQPLNTTKNRLIALNTATYFATGDYAKAVTDGLALMGHAGDAWTTVTTDEYQLLNHQVMDYTKALTCSECHPNATATQVKLVSELGYGLKGAQSVVCAQCHRAKTPTSYDRMHSRHVDSKGYDCSWCHTFSRPERGLTMPQ